MPLGKKEKSWFRHWLEFIVMYLVLFPITYVGRSDYYFDFVWKIAVLMYIAGSIFALFYYKYNLEEKLNR